MGTTPTAHDWTAGDDATSTFLETLTDAANYALGRVTSGGSRKPLAILSLTVAQSLTTAVAAALSFDSEVTDYDNSHSTVTNPTRYTGLTPGTYFAYAGAAFASNATGYRQLGITQNGSATPQVGGALTVNAVNGQPTQVQAGAPVILNGSTDYFEIQALQNSGGALNVTSARLLLFWLST